MLVVDAVPVVRVEEDDDELAAAAATRNASMFSSNTESGPDDCFAFCTDNVCVAVGLSWV